MKLCVVSVRRNLCEGLLRMYALITEMIYILKCVFKLRRSHLSFVFRLRTG